ncbi:hypothetical protein MRX96_057931 [Rhipicephalus microplus]
MTNDAFEQHTAHAYSPSAFGLPAPVPTVQLRTGAGSKCVVTAAGKGTPIATPRPRRLPTSSGVRLHTIVVSCVVRLQAGSCAKSLLSFLLLSTSPSSLPVTLSPSSAVRRPSQSVELVGKQTIALAEKRKKARGDDANAESELPVASRGMSRRAARTLMPNL